MRRVYPPAAHKRIADLLREHIETGLYVPGEKLPTIDQFASLHSVRPGVAYEALRLLCLEELVVARRGDGYYVSDVPRETEEEY